MEGIVVINAMQKFGGQKRKCLKSKRSNARNNLCFWFKFINAINMLYMLDVNGNKINNNVINTRKKK